MLTKIQDAIRNVIAPLILATTFFNFLWSIPALSAFNFLIFLRQIFTEPLLFFGRKRKREWGVVYDSLTKQPIDLAMVRLFDKETGKLVETRVTDLQGRYIFIVEPEKMYYITVEKNNYTFPSKLLENS